MARWSTVTIGELDSPTVLSPERYDPARTSDVDGVPLRDLVGFPRESVSPKKASARSDEFILVDTGDAREGRLRASANVKKRDDLGSTKRIALAGDVIISRLRPYLRQVAFVDEAACGSPILPLACSTEFYVLRSMDERSIAFVAAFLLSRTPQRILAASQEGGHHPRFSQQAIGDIRVPRSVLERRDELSASVEDAARALRLSDQQIEVCIESCEVDE